MHPDDLAEYRTFHALDVSLTAIYTVIKRVPYLIVKEFQTVSQNLELFLYLDHQTQELDCGIQLCL